MEAAKRLFPDRNGSQNRDGSMMGWSVWKFHSILHKAMELLLYGWSENVSTQSGGSAHKVLFNIIPHMRFQLDDVKWLNCTVTDQRQGHTAVHKSKREIVVFGQTTPKETIG